MNATAQLPVSHRQDRLAEMQPSPIRAIHNLADQLKREDPARSFIQLHLGEPDLGTPSFIVEAAVEAVRGGAVFYENNRGRTDLLEELARYCQTHYDTRLNADNLVVTCGGVQAILLVMLGLLSPGDDAIICTPAWPNFKECAKLAGANVHELALTFDSAEREFRLDQQKLEALANRLPNLRLVVINTPSNPTGNVLSREEKETLLDFSRRHGVTLVADEMYDRLVFLEGEDPSFLSLRRDDDRLVVINGFAKTYAMTGWRLGYLVTDAALASRLGFLQEFVTSHAPSMVQVAAITALREGEAFVRQSLERYRRLRNLVLERLNSMPGVVTARPDGSFYAFFTHPATADSMGFAEAVLRETGLMLAPGAAFGAGGEGWMRLCFAKEEALLQEACDRLGDYVQRHKA